MAKRGYKVLRVIYFKDLTGVPALGIVAQNAQDCHPAKAIVVTDRDAVSAVMTDAFVRLHDGEVRSPQKALIKAVYANEYLSNHLYQEIC